MGKSLPSTTRLQELARVVTSEKIQSPKHAKPASTNRVSAPETAKLKGARLKRNPMVTLFFLFCCFGYSPKSCIMILSFNKAVLMGNPPTSTHIFIFFLLFSTSTAFKKKKKHQNSKYNKRYKKKKKKSKLRKKKENDRN